MDFKNKEVADRYTAPRGYDVVINGEGYHGKLSDITLEGAAWLVSTGDANIEKKDVAPVSAETVPSQTEHTEHAIPDEDVYAEQKQENEV